MKLHLYEDDITPEFLEWARRITKKVFAKKTCTLVIHNSLDKVIYEEVITNEEKEKKEQKKKETKKN